MQNIYDRVCRTDFNFPGYYVFNLGKVPSEDLRARMIELKEELEKIHFKKTNKVLSYKSAARFDQQVTTKLHRDNGPEESFLILGYEPSEVESELFIADYSFCAHKLGLTPQQFLEKHNPMFGTGEELLKSFTQKIALDNTASYMVIINNSLAAFNDKSWLGVLHMASILKPDENHRRVINSILIESSTQLDDLVSEHELDDFKCTKLVRRKGYDKQHLEDD
jgi:hypothetical protein